MAVGIYQGATSHGSVIELRVGGRSLFGDHRPTLNSLEQSGLQVGDLIEYQADGDLMAGFRIIGIDELCPECGGAGRITTEHHGSHTCGTCEGSGFARFVNEGVGLDR